MPSLIAILLLVVAAAFIGDFAVKERWNIIQKRMEYIPKRIVARAGS
jgi:hypothetical protein